MKPLSGTLAFIGLIAVVMIVFACCMKPTSSGQLVDVKIGDPDAKPPRYAELKGGLASEGKLRAALAKIKRHNGVCDITFLRDPAHQPDLDYCKHIDVSLKTDRIIKSEVASNGANDSSAANDPNLMYRIASPDPTDITGVLELLKP